MTIYGPPDVLVGNKRPDKLKVQFSDQGWHLLPTLRILERSTNITRIAETQFWSLLLFTFLQKWSYLTSFPNLENKKKQYHAFMTPFSDIRIFSFFFLDKYFMKQSNIMKIAPNIEVELVATVKIVL